MYRSGADGQRAHKEIIGKVSANAIKQRQGPLHSLQITIQPKKNGTGDDCPG